MNEGITDAKMAHNNKHTTMANNSIMDMFATGLRERKEEKILEILLRDHTRKAIAEQQAHIAIKEDECANYHIIWATKDYAHLGAGYGEQDMIQVEAVLDRQHVLLPRAMKERAVQRERTQQKAEVFTPAWVCNAQNNLIDEAWFGRRDVFNTTQEEGRRWQATKGKVEFPEERTWKDYVSEPRLEITCGEAPYIVSRYDAGTGEPIPIAQRIGLLDRKLRVVGENTENETEWIAGARKAVESCYGYEWQGDSLLLARLNILVSVVEYYQHKFHTSTLPPKSGNGRDPLCAFAYIISWNLWQMDGLRQTLPYFEDDCLLRKYWEQRTRKQKDKQMNGEDLFAAEGGTTSLFDLEAQIPFCRIRTWAALGSSCKGKKELFVQSIQD